MCTSASIDVSNTDHYLMNKLFNKNVYFFLNNFPYKFTFKKYHLIIILPNVQIKKKFKFKIYENEKFKIFYINIIIIIIKFLIGTIEKTCHNCFYRCRINSHVGLTKVQNTFENK